MQYPHSRSLAGSVMSCSDKPHHSQLFYSFLLEAMGHQWVGINLEFPEASGWLPTGPSTALALTG